MNRIIFFLIILIGELLSNGATAQKHVTTFGLQVKPIIPSKFFDTGIQTIAGDLGNYELVPRLGYNFGMVIRWGFTDVFSLESGINVINRKYQVSVDDQDLGFKSSINTTFVGYEVPIMGMVFVQLGNDWWMNGAGGMSIDMYPSNTFSSTYNTVDTVTVDFAQKTYRYNWAKVSLLANLGFEYRSKDQGYFYFGASYHRPFSNIGVTDLNYSKKQDSEIQRFELSGSYLTLDLKYFFHENPDRKKQKKKSL